MTLVNLCRSCVGILAFFFVVFCSFGQVNNAGSPITFTNGNTINTADIRQATHSGSTNPYIDNPIEVLGMGGMLVGSPGVTFLNAITGTGPLTLNLTGSSSVGFGYAFTDKNSISRFTNGFILKSGGIDFEYGANIIDGSLSVVGNSTITGNVIFTSNNIAGNSGVTLNGSATFLGSGADFNFNSGIKNVTLANTSGTQRFGGPVVGMVKRVANGGTSIFTSSITGQILAYGGTTVLTGSLGRVSGDGIYLQGGKVVLDNTLANNDSRIDGGIRFYGGDLSLLGVNGGATVQSVAAPTFSQGLNKISIASGTGPDSSAVLMFNGTPNVGTGNSGSVDFSGLTSTSQIFFSGRSAGPLGAWATVNGIEFATYDTTNGVQAMSNVGRPSQVKDATAQTYVLASGSQDTLSQDVTAGGVTMNGGTILDLGGKRLSLGGWIQNGSAGVITNGTIGNNSQSSSNIYFTTNADLSIQTAIRADTFIKNGEGTLTLEGGVTTNFTQFYINSGKMNLNVTNPFQSVQAEATFVIGESAGEPGSAELNLLADNQFSSTGSSGSFVGIRVKSAGKFNLNGYDANLSFLEVSGGKVDIGNGELTVGSISANATSTAGEIVNGTINLRATNNSYGGSIGDPIEISVTNMTYQDGLIIGSRIVSNSNFVKIGNGTLVLNNALNSFGNGTVGLTLTEGVVALQNSGAIGSADQIVQFNGGALRADSVGPLILTNPIRGGAVVTSGSDIVFAGGYTQTTYGAAFSPSNTLTIKDYAINVSNGYSSNNGPGTLVLSGTASGSTTGAFTQINGTLAIDSDAPLPTGMTLVYQGGTIEAINSSRTISNKLTISSDITFSGSQALTFSATTGNSLDSSKGSVYRSFYVNGTGKITINNLKDSNFSTLSMGGSGTLVLSGNPTGFDAANVNSGILRIKSNNSTGASLGAISVNGQGVFGGTGIVKGSTTVESGGVIDSGDDLGMAGILEFQSGLTLKLGAILNFDLGKATGTDLLQITGGIFETSGTGSTVLNFRNSGDFDEGMYTLISWTGESSISISDFILGETIDGYQYNLSVLNNSLKLQTVAIPEPGSAFLLLIGMATVVFSSSSYRIFSFFRRSDD